MFKKCKDFYSRHKEGINLILKIISFVGFGTILYFCSLLSPIYEYVKQLILDDVVLFIIFVLLIYVICQLHFIKKYTKSLIVEEFDIVSDENTLFVESKKHSSIPPNTQAVATRVHELWRHHTDQYFQFFKSSKWIAHAVDISNEEATDGGDYNFKRQFSFPISRDKIISAQIFIVVDDYCTIILNGKIICENLTGFSKLHVAEDIKDYIVAGDNEIRFQIRNISLHELAPDKNYPVWQSNQKYLYNPYGFKYRMLIKYKK